MLYLPFKIKMEKIAISHDNLSTAWFWLLNLTVFVILAKHSYLASILAIKCLRMLYGPMNYEQDMTIKEYCKEVAEINNNLVKRSTQQDIEDLVKRNTKQDEFKKSDEKLPYNDHNSYPNGWLPVIESSSVGVGQIRRAMIIGLDVIVCRSLQGKVSVLDAYCPHMGVHIGIGGRVVEVESDSCVQCPFHGWIFRMIDGKCVEIPYAMKQDKKRCDSLPKQAKLKVWHCCEVDEFIYIWHHVDGLPPSWTIEPTPELRSGSWVLAGRSCHITNINSGDILENGADIHHFEGIHNDIFLLGCDISKIRPLNWLQKYVKHCWDPDWRPIYDDKGAMTHKAMVKLDSWVKFFNLNIFHIEVRALQIGTACVSLHYKSNWYGPGVIKMNAIRLGGRRTKYVQHLYTKDVLFCKIMAKMVLYGEIKQLERDLIMWNHRKNLNSPVLVPQDKIVKLFRMWYSQFYKRKIVIA